MSSVSIRLPRPSDASSFLDAVLRSRALHHPWTHPPSTQAAVREFLSRPQRDPRFNFLIFYNRRDLVGVVSISEIVRGSFQSAYLGYYAFEPLAGKGLMHEGLARVITRAFSTLKLHRLEANIQPGNARSINLVKALGFRHEGFSPRYLKIGGRWRDHERWTILVDDWV
jgi:ribosomal-protein-alanine N-acetyltransferase